MNIKYLKYLIKILKWDNVHLVVKEILQKRKNSIVNLKQNHILVMLIRFMMIFKIH